MVSETSTSTAVVRCDIEHQVFSPPSQQTLGNVQLEAAWHIMKVQLNAYNDTSDVVVRMKLLISLGCAVCFTNIFCNQLHGGTIEVQHG